MGKIAAPMAKKGRKPTKKKARASRSESDDPRRHPPGSDSGHILRQLRRRRQHYSDYYDDLYDFEEEDDDEQERRKEKKLKLVLRVPPSAAHDSSDCETEGRSPMKKRKISRCNDVDGDGDDDDGVRSTASGDEKEGKAYDRQEDAAADSPPGSSASPFSMPLPDAKTLELILDKLQKKDIYGVYAEPVDPEELPDYHEVIENPMDFSTIRKKLASGAYSSFEQFESDVFLICTNAMQYNAPETVYFKQARAIQELAKNRFKKVRTDEWKSAPKSRFDTSTEKPVKPSSPGGVQESTGIDIPAATLATTGDSAPVLSTTLACGAEKPENVDSLAMDKSISSSDNRVEKMEEVPAKCFIPKVVRKVFDENRRVTYYTSCQPEGRTDSVFTVFGGEIKQLVVAGLQADHSYARSLARFAAILGPVTWRVASKRIEQVLPEGYSYGRGWVGEYEPLPTPVLTVKDYSCKQQDSRMKSCRTETRKVDRREELGALWKYGPRNVKLENGPHLGEVASVKIMDPMKPGGTDTKLERSGLSTEIASQKQNILLSVDSSKTDSVILKQAAVSSLDAVSGIPAEASPKRPEYHVEVTSSRLLERPLRHDENIISASVKPQDEKLLPIHCPSYSGKGLPNGISRCSGIRPGGFSWVSVPSHQQILSSIPSSINHQQGLDDPVKLLKNLSGNLSNGTRQLNPASSIEMDSHSALSTPLSGIADTGTYAVRPWMSIGPTVSHNETREPLNVQNSLLSDAILSPGSGIQEPWSQGSRSRFFPQHMRPDMLRFHVPSWQDCPPDVQPRESKDIFAPDLNIGFQPPSSPIRQSSSIRLDSQQPDLALQL